MKMLGAHINALGIWLFLGGQHRLYLFLSTIPVLWMFWGVCSPVIVSGEIDLKNTFLSLFAAWYSFCYLQDFTNGDPTLGLTGTSRLPSCPALPISPLMRIGAELLFFLIVSTLLFIPLFFIHFIFALPPGEQDLSTGQFLLSALQGTLAIAPIVFSIRMNVNGNFFLPATLRMALPVILCGAFFLFQIMGLFTTWPGSTLLCFGQIAILCAVFIWFHNRKDLIRIKTGSKYFSRYLLDDSVFYLLLGRKARRNPRTVDSQIVMDLAKVIMLYVTYWVCLYFPLMAAMYYIFINVLDKPVMSWFFFLLLLILPTQDNHAFKDRFLIPALILPVRQDRVIRWFYIMFSMGIVVIWTLPLLVTSFFKAKNYLSLLPFILLFAPTIAGVWVNRILKKPALVFAGVGLLCCLPLGYFFNILQATPQPFFLCAFIGAILPFKSMTPFK